MLVHIALAHARQDRPQRAATVLQEALALAAPANYIYVFLSAGSAIAALLDQIEPSTNKQRAYIQTLRQAFWDDDVANSAIDTPVPSAERVAQDALIEPLSDRELELLNLVANGHSNREIAYENFYFNRWYTR